MVWQNIIVWYGIMAWYQAKMSLPKYSAGGKSMRQPIKGESQPLFHFSRLRAFIDIVEQLISVSYKSCGQYPWALGKQPKCFRQYSGGWRRGLSGKVLNMLKDASSYSLCRLMLPIDQSISNEKLKRAPEVIWWKRGRLCRLALPHTSTHIKPPARGRII